jgi:hypothetical protein
VVLNPTTPTTDEIERRVGDADSTRTTKRVATAKRIGELARRRASVAEQLADIEQQLGIVLAESSDVIEIDELARFTDVSAADLTHWRDSRRTTRSKHKRQGGTTAPKRRLSQGQVTPEPVSVDHPSVRPTAPDTHAPDTARPA